MFYRPDGTYPTFSNVAFFALVIAGIIGLAVVMNALAPAITHWLK
jgi:hypothetical protein